MVVPAKFNLLSKNSWGVVITYLEDGYVKDDEAESIDYSKLGILLRDTAIYNF